MKHRRERKGAEKRKALIDLSIDDIQQNDIKVIVYHEDRIRPTKKHLVDRKKRSSFIDGSNEREKPYLILDLDETLVKSLPQLENDIDDEDINHEEFKIYKLTGDIETFVCKEMINMIKELNKMYTLCIFSMGTESYVNEVVDLIDEDNVIDRTRVFAREDYHENGKSQSKMISLLLKDNPKLPFLIYDDSLFAWRNFESIEGNFIYSKALCIEAIQSSEKPYLFNFGFDLKKTFDFGKFANLVSCDIQKAPTHFQKMLSVFTRIAEFKETDVWMSTEEDKKIDFKKRIEKIRAEVLKGSIFYLYFKQIPFTSIVAKMIKILGGSITNHVSSLSTILIFNQQQSLSIVNEHAKKSNISVYNVKYIFDCFFYMNKQNLNNYKLI